MADSSDETTPPQSNPPPSDSPTFTQQIQHQPVSARVTERVVRGVTSTGVVVLDTPNEFVLDFLQGLVRPFQIAARVVVPPSMMQQLVLTLSDNLNKYTQNFGAPPALPKPPAKRPTVAEIYENFKLSDDMLSGAYANNIRVGHSPAEFFLDFITDFYPTAAVSARIFIAPSHIPRLLDTFKVSLDQYRKRHAPPKPPTE
jgi:uncharacterized protein DUF3467